MNMMHESEGTEFSFERLITDNDVEEFAKLTGDINPLHLDPEFAYNTRFKHRVIHGMLAASFFSTLIGMYLPKKKNLYLSQTLDFKKPIAPNTLVKVKGKIIRSHKFGDILVIQTDILSAKTGELFVTGEATVTSYE